MDAKENEIISMEFTRREWGILRSALKNLSEINRARYSSNQLRVISIMGQRIGGRLHESDGNEMEKKRDESLLTQVLDKADSVIDGVVGKRHG